MPVIAPMLTHNQAYLAENPDPAEVLFICKQCGGPITRYLADSHERPFICGTKCLIDFSNAA